MARTFVLILVFFSVPAWALKEYYSLGCTPRAMALGGAFYGLSDDEGALFYNPAGLSAYEGGTQIFAVTVGATASSTLPGALSALRDVFSKSTDTATMVSRLQPLQGRILSGGAEAFPFVLTRGFALGVLVGGVKGNVLLSGREIDSDLDVTGVSDSGLFLGKSISFGKSPLRMGVTLKVLGRIGGRKLMTLIDFVNETPVKLSDLGGFGVGFDADVGFLWMAKRGTGLGLTFSNLFATTFPWARSGTIPPPRLPRTVSLGGFVTTGNFQWRLDLSEFGLGGQSDPDLGARTGSFFKHLNLGVEWVLGRALSLRAGLHQGSPTAGLGLQLTVLRLDFATWGEELGLNPGKLSSRRYGLRLAFGYAGGAGPSKK